MEVTTISQSMNLKILRKLSCPVCREPLKSKGTMSDGRMVKGFLKCSKGHLYQVKDEIPIIKNPETSIDEFSWNVEFPDLQKYEEVRQAYLSHLSEEQKEADRLLLKELTEKVISEKLILDIASGMGRLLLELSSNLQKDATIIGTDVDEKPLRGAKLKLVEQKIYSNVSLCVMDGKNLAFNSEEVPCITSFFGFDNISECENAFQEAYRVLDQNGRLAFATLWLEKDSARAR